MRNEKVKWIARWILCNTCRDTSSGNLEIGIDEIAVAFGVMEEDIRKDRYRIMDAAVNDCFLGDWLLDIQYVEGSFSGWDSPDGLHNTPDIFSVDVSSYFSDDYDDTCLEEGRKEAMDDLQKAEWNLKKHMDIYENGPRR